MGEALPAPHLVHRRLPRSRPALWRSHWLSAIAWTGLLVIGMTLFSTLNADSDPLAVNGPPVVLSTQFSVIEVQRNTAARAAHPGEHPIPRWLQVRRSVERWSRPPSQWLRHVLHIRGP